MSKSYVLDTSAIFTLTKAEDGCGTVEEIIDKSKRNTASVYLSFITLTELYYITWQKKNESAAKELIILVKSLPVQIVNSNERLALAAGKIKASNKLSIADAYVAATAEDKSAVLVHKDPELEVVSNRIRTVELPYKKSKTKF